MFTYIWYKLSASVCNPVSCSFFRQSLSFRCLQMSWQQKSCCCMDTTHLLAMWSDFLVFSCLVSQFSFALDCVLLEAGSILSVCSHGVLNSFSLLLVLRNLSNFKHFEYRSSKYHSFSTRNLVILYSE